MTLLQAPLNLNFRDEASAQGAISGTDNLFGHFVSSALNGVFVIGMLLVLFNLVSGGLDYISAAGDKGKTESARNKMTGAVVGIFVLASSLAIFMVVQNFLGVEILTWH